MDGPNRNFDKHKIPADIEFGKDVLLWTFQTFYDEETRGPASVTSSTEFDLDDGGRINAHLFYRDRQLVTTQLKIYKIAGTDPSISDQLVRAMRRTLEKKFRWDLSESDALLAGDRFEKFMEEIPVLYNLTCVNCSGVLTPEEWVKIGCQPNTKPKPVTFSVG